MSNSEIQKEVENFSGGGGGGSFDLYQPNTVAAESGKRVVNPREFLFSLRKKSEAQSIGQKRESFFEECCDKQGIDIQSFHISEIFSHEEREEVIDDFCREFGRHDLISKVSSKTSYFVEPTYGAFRNLRDDLRAEETRGKDPQADALEAISDVEIALLSNSSKNYVLLEGDIDDDGSVDDNFSLAFQALLNIVQRDDARMTEAFTSNFLLAAKDEIIAKSLVDAEKDILRARANFEAQKATEYRIDERSPQERSDFRAHIRQQLNGPLQDMCFSLSLKRRLFNLIEEIVRLPEASEKASAKEATAEAATLTPPDSGILASIAAKSSKATAR